MSIDNDIAEELVRTGPPTFKFPTVGTKLRLRIASVRKSQQTDMAGKLLTWDNGDPRWQYEFAGIDLDTGEETRIFAKKQMLTAVKEAFRTAEAKPEVDGELIVLFDHEEPPSTPGFNPQKVYKAKYVPPAPVADIDDL